MGVCFAVCFKSILRPPLNEKKKKKCPFIFYVKVKGKWENIPRITFPNFLKTNYSLKKVLKYINAKKNRFKVKLKLVDSRFFKDACHAAAHQQEELLREEDPGDLLQRGLRLAPQVQDGGAEEGDAQPEAEEHAPVGERLLQVVLEERADALVQRLHGGAPPQSRNLLTAARCSCPPLPVRIHVGSESKHTAAESLRA